MKLKTNDFSITNLPKGNPALAGLPFALMKEAVLGKKHELSLVFISSSKIKDLNRKFRDKNTSTDILSFPLSSTKGEIFICLSQSRKEAKKFERKYENFVAFLFIHGLVHLKGMTHGSRMEALERKFRKKFGV